MAVTGNISFKIGQCTTVNGRNKHATVYGVGGTLTGDPQHQKYMAEIIAHALSRMDINVDNERFTYTFPFHMR